MEGQDDGMEPLGGLNHHGKAQEPGSPPLACEHTGSLQQEKPGIMRRIDNYLPVPGEEKNLDADFVNTKDRSSESIPMKNLYGDDVSSMYPQGPYFSDGRRRVDYVLAYHIQKPASVRRRSSRFDNAFIRQFRRSLSMRSSRAPLQPKEDPEIAAQEQQTDYHEDDKRFRREEYEENLLETGLELERDESGKIPGIGFLKIHAPWSVLCREAEFMKLKMPTKKVYDVKQGSNVVEKIRLFIHKVTAPLHPKVDATRQDNVKSLSHPFSREKQHLAESRAEQSRTEQSRAEQSRAEQSRAEQSRAEQSREQNRAEQNRAEQNRAEQSRAEQRAEQSRTEQSRAESRTEQSRTEQSRAEQSRTEQSRAEQSRAEQSRTEQSRAEQNRTEQNRTEQNRAEQNRAEQSRAEQSRAEQSRAEQSRAEQNRAEQSRAEQNRAEQNRAEQSRAEQRAEQSRTEQSRAEQNRAEQNRTEQSRAEQSRTEQNRTEQSRAEQNSRAEQSRAEQNRAEQSRAEQSRAEQSRAEMGAGEFDLSDRDKFFDSKTRSSIGDIEEANAGPNDRKLLYEEWASYSVFYKYQPIGLIRKYFGEKVGLYFAWLGVYTQMLIPAAIVGVIVFLYGCATVDDNIPSMEICDPRNNITMCPLCDRACSYWKLVTACGTARASHLFDNPATVFFSIFMALWAVLFMEHWKRRQMRLNYIWDLTGFGEEEEEEHKDHNRAEYEFRVMQKTMKLEHSVPKGEKVKLTCTDRMPAYLTTVMMMCFLVPKTDKSFEERLIFKTFILKFVNAFTPIVYLAFFRGR
ncbi:hypothetical protein INR49_028860 [Caranx melampygus]|nr:hypothetical protein INR49_028860 [Caranx melampygus]